MKRWLLVLLYILSIFIFSLINNYHTQMVLLKKGGKREGTFLVASYFPFSISKLYLIIAVHGGKCMNF